MSKVRVLHLTSSAPAVNRWRSWWPVAALAAHGVRARSVDWAETDTLRHVLEDWEIDPEQHGYDLVVTPRYVMAQPWMNELLVARVHKLGAKLVYDLDDDLLSPEVIDQQLRTKTEDQDGWRQQFEYERRERTRLLLSVDAVTVSTEPLKRVVQMFTPKPVYVLPNLIDLVGFTPPVWMERPSSQPVTVGWAGGVRDEADLRPLAIAWSELASEFPDLHFKIIGHQSPSLISAVPASRLHLVDWCDSLGDYVQALGGIDIGCCPLAPTPWNGCKSPIKWMEMTLAGAACVVSDPVYGPAVGVDSVYVVAPGYGEARWWRVLIGGLVRSLVLRSNLWRASHARVLEHHTIQRNWPLWRDTYERIAAL